MKVKLTGRVKGKELKKEMKYSNKCPKCESINWKEYRRPIMPHDSIKCLECGHMMPWVDYLLLKEFTSLDVFEESLTKEEQNEVRKLFKDKARREERERIEKALKDSIEFLKTLPEPFNKEGKTLHFSFDDLKISILSLAVRNEICTLRWVLKMKGSKMNCYSEELKKELKISLKLEIEGECKEPNNPDCNCNYCQKVMELVKEKELQP